MIGRLQTNKVKFALKIFDYIHSLDSEKLAIKISEEHYITISKKLLPLVSSLMFGEACSAVPVFKKK